MMLISHLKVLILCGSVLLMFDRVPQRVPQNIIPHEVLKNFQSICHEIDFNKPGAIRAIRLLIDPFTKLLSFEIFSHPNLLT